MREEIIREIRRLAADAGHAPGQKAFARDTGIQEHQWRGKLSSPQMQGDLRNLREIGEAGACGGGELV